MRLTFEQLNIIKKKMNVEQLWSFSKYSTFSQCSWLYKLKYIDKIKVKGDSCYTYFGSIAHDVIQDFYDGKHTYDEMIDKFEQAVLDWQVKADPKLAFPSDNVRDGYIDNLRHYFKHTAKIPYKVVNEKAIMAVFEGVEKYVFQGYIDSEYVDENGVLTILDYKTSSMSGFSGAKLLEKSYQLMVYTMAIIRNGRMVDGKKRQFTLDKVRIRYDMMKYVNVTFKLKNGTEKVTKAERREWVKHIEKKITKDFQDVRKDIEKLQKEIGKLERKIKMKKTTPEEAEGYNVEIGKVEEQINQLKPFAMEDFEITPIVQTAIEENTLESLPEFIQEKYSVDNCYIDVELTQDIIDDFEKSLVGTLDTIVQKTAEDNPDEAFDRERIGNADSFYCNTLCDMKDHCKFYEDYKAHSAMFVDKPDEQAEEDILAMLGL